MEKKSVELVYVFLEFLVAFVSPLFLVSHFGAATRD